MAKVLFPKSAVNAESLSQILEVNFSFNKNNSPDIAVESINIKNGYAPRIDSLEDQYALQVLDAKNNILVNQKFDAPVKIVTESFEESGSIKGEVSSLDQTNFTITLKYPDQADSIKVLDKNGTTLLSNSLAGVNVANNSASFFSEAQYDQSPSNLDSASNGFLDIVFISNNYNGNYSLFQNDVSAFTSNLQTYEPFRSRAPQLRFYSVQSNANLGCTRDTVTQRLILCDQSLVTQQINNAAVPYDKIVVIHNDQNYGGGAALGGLMAVSYNGASGPQVFVHEFGHALGSLYDEYISFGSIPADNAVYFNCYSGIPTTDVWPGIPRSGYAQGCTYQSWYRSSQTSIMHDISQRFFNAVSQKYINDRFDFFTRVVQVPSPLPSFSASPMANVNLSGHLSADLTEAGVGSKVAVTYQGVDPNHRLSKIELVLINSAQERTVLKSFTCSNRSNCLDNFSFVPTTAEEYVLAVNVFDELGNQCAGGPAANSGLKSCGTEATKPLKVYTLFITAQSGCAPDSTVTNRGTGPYAKISYSYPGADVKNWVVYRSPGFELRDHVVLGAPFHPSSFVDALESNKQYSYTLKASTNPYSLDPDPTSPTSNTVIINPISGCEGKIAGDIKEISSLTPPTNFRLTSCSIRNDGAYTFSMAWDSVPGATGYKIYRDSQSNAPVGNTTAPLLTESAWGISHPYWVKAVSSSGESNFSNRLGTDQAGLCPAKVTNKTAGDYDGDRKADAIVFQHKGVSAGQNNWWIINSSNNQWKTTSWGATPDFIPVQGDYDGDGKEDYAVVQISNATWHIIYSSNGQYVAAQWGYSTDIPVPGDYDGDSKADIMVYRPSDGSWYRRLSTGGYIHTTWGYATDIPIPADYDGDGKTDITIFRPSNGAWYGIGSIGGNIIANWGKTGDIPITADFDGDSKTDMAVFRPNPTGSEPNWYIQPSRGGAAITNRWGDARFVPVPADYDGDTKADFALVKTQGVSPGEVNWYVSSSSTGQARSFSWGASDQYFPLNRSPYFIYKQLRP